MKRTKLMSRRQRWLIVIIIIACVLGIFLILFIPWNISKLSSHPRPVSSYAEALQRIEAWKGDEPGEMNPVCQVQLMTHGQKVERAIILVHGYTNCPQQFHELGQRFYDLGYNVLIPPLPHHGLADRMTDTQAQITAEELAAYTDETVDIAQGLGDQVVMMGISAGGVATAWAAQYRQDLDLAVIISPAFGFKQIPTSLTTAIANIYTFLPDEFVWWDPELREEGSPEHVYPRYSKHAMAQTLRFGLAVQVEARRNPPAAKKIVLVTNAFDNSVNNELILQVATDWQAHHANLSRYEFEADLRLGHDLIDPDQPGQPIETVYSRLIELVSR